MHIFIIHYIYIIDNTTYIVEMMNPCGGYWIGLVNIDRVTCTDDSCLHQLHWVSDNTPLTERDTLNIKIDGNSAYTKYTNGEISEPLKTERKFICQFSCDKGTIFQWFCFTTTNVAQ